MTWFIGIFHCLFYSRNSHRYLLFLTCVLFLAQFYILTILQSYDGAQDDQNDDPSSSHRKHTWSQFYEKMSIISISILLFWSFAKRYSIAKSELLTVCICILGLNTVMTLYNTFVLNNVLHWDDWFYTGGGTLFAIKVMKKIRHKVEEKLGVGEYLKVQQEENGEMEQGANQCGIPDLEMQNQENEGNENQGVENLEMTRPMSE